MEQAITIFIMGILGVFTGMALIYLAIKLTSVVADYFHLDNETP